MEDQTIKNLREALKFSPDNVPLKMHLAQTLFNAGLLDDAEKEYSELMRLTNDLEPQKVLANTFFKQEAYSKCIVLVEGLLDEYPDDFDLNLLYARTLLRENSIAAAKEAYQQVVQMRPGFADDELDGALRMTTQLDDNDMLEELDDPTFLQKPSVKFDNVGGMDGVKKEIDLKIIKPIQHADLYKAYGKKAGGGILLYGPPGCGKTFIAKATAGEVDAKFINVGLNDILDMWIGNSEKNLNRIFETARNNTPCVLFFDEIDALEPTDPT
ncbi:MAG: ATP-binding protein [Saprospiraceae bacterium]